MRPIERRLRDAENGVPMFDFSRLSDSELRDAAIEEMAAANPEQAAVLRRAGERIRAGAAWPIIGPCEALEEEYDVLFAGLLAIGMEAA